MIRLRIQLHHTRGHLPGRLSSVPFAGTVFSSIPLIVAMSSATEPEVKDPYFQSLFADRIGGANYGKSTEIYKFEKIKRAKRNALAAHPDRQLLDFGIGENDAMADEAVRQVMAKEINQPENRGYADNGVIEYKQAAARFMKRHFDVDLDPVTQINHCIGSKPAYAMRAHTPATMAAKCSGCRC